MQNIAYTPGSVFPPAIPLAPARRVRFAAGLAAAGLTFLLSATGASGADALDNWEETAPNQFALLFSGITFGNGTFVAAGANGLLATSSDGFQWTARSH